ncbi:MAG: flagella biosynthesis regulator FlaF [Roseibaca calidilacus]|uniref:Flagella biosynthesis regulator FlaF n=1 Tax=Roseibaca calidilacus TaxID=1666912 RepID=A0A0P7WL48_9RHOB|nr:flagellar biosynthesis regulator FlaF [Roseibaca calidilacus]KPP91534.1 MAG: flagella biosynthesis regulator FlaF [Roseibaca calidilacus]CUX82961.1 flagellar protein FlaF [Roseibaca calidilacus]
MNAHAQALAAYGTPNIAQKPPRAVEYDALAQVTARLRAAIAGGPTAFPALADALDANRRLWTEFTFDLASDENLLPTALRAQLLGLAKFIMSHSDAVLNGRDHAEVLVDLNVAIMRGLNGESGLT